jgi:hypothetical protein
MHNASFSFLLTLLVLALWAPRTASAQGSVKITISGGGLPSPIELTDQRILDINWGGASVGALASEPPQGAPYYEVSFYIEIEANDIRKTMSFTTTRTLQPGAASSTCPEMEWFGN